MDVVDLDLINDEIRTISEDIRFEEFKSRLDVAVEHLLIEANEAFEAINQESGFDYRIEEYMKEIL